MVVLLINDIGEIILGMEILGGFEVFHIILDGMGGYSMNEGYILNFHNLEMDTSNEIEYTDGFWGVIMWIHSCNFK